MTTTDNGANTTAAMKPIHKIFCTMPGGRCFCRNTIDSICNMTVMVPKNTTNNPDTSVHPVHRERPIIHPYTPAIAVITTSSHTTAMGSGADGPPDADRPDRDAPAIQATPATGMSSNHRTDKLNEGNMGEGTR